MTELKNKINYVFKDNGIMWIARNKNGTLRLFNQQPYRVNKKSYWTVDPSSSPVACDYMLVDVSLFPELKWTDEPKEVFISSLETELQYTKQISLDDEIEDNTEFLSTDEDLTNMLKPSNINRIL